MTIYPPTCMTVKWGVEKRELNGGGEGPKQTVFFSHHSAQFDSGAVQGSTPAGPSLYSNWASIIASLTCHFPVCNA